MKTVAELEARIKELEDAVDWLGSIPRCCEKSHGEWKELYRRAFPPQFEEVSVRGWANPRNNDFYMESNPEYVAEELYPATLNFKRPIPTKVKRREELEWSGMASQYVCKSDKCIPPGNHKKFAEWEE